MPTKYRQVVFYTCITLIPIPFFLLGFLLSEMLSKTKAMDDHYSSGVELLKIKHRIERNDSSIEIVGDIDDLIIQNTKLLMSERRTLSKID